MSVIWNVDDTFTVNKKRAYDIFADLIIEKDTIWTLLGVGADRYSDLELLKRWRRQDNWVAYGFESGSEAVRQGVRKGQKHIWEAVNMTYEAELNINI